MTNEAFEQKLIALKLSKKDFANLAKLPYTTLNNWKRNATAPAWVEPFLYYYERHIDLCAIEKIFKNEL